MKWLFLLGALLACFGCGAGCGRKAGGCDRNSDCPAGQVCLVEHRCQALPPPPVLRLSVAKTGDGEGTVLSEPTGISCGNSCRFVFPEGTRVRLLATPGPRSSFAGWSEGCSGTGACEPAQGGMVLATFIKGPADGPRAASAQRPLCVGQCSEVARACKGTCKLRYSFGSVRHDCALGCEVREHECRARARC